METETALERLSAQRGSSQPHPGRREAGVPPSVMGRLPFFAHLLLPLLVLCGGQPILPSLSYPVFILTPPDILKTEAGAQFHPLPSEYQQNFQTVSDAASEPDLFQVPPPQQPGFEVSQFHSQDEDGRVVYGFHGPDQSRMEARSIDGTVRGAYSYIDPNGNIVRMQYWDDGSGFHVTGNALPNGQPAFTPEVAAARAQHLKLYQAALQAAGHQLPSSHFGNGNDDVDDTSINQHFDDPHFNKGTDTNHLFEEDSDTVSLDNPELFGNFNIQEEEKNEQDEKPSVSGVEGEVELGEDVGPEEDEEDPVDEGQGDEGQHEEQHNYFRKNENNNEGNNEESNEDNSEGINEDNNEETPLAVSKQQFFKVVKNNADVPKKYFFRQRYPMRVKESLAQNNEETNHGHQEDDGLHELESGEEDVNDEKGEVNDGEDEPEENENHQQNEENVNGNHDDNGGNVEENADEHFDTVEHIFVPEEIDEENYRRSDHLQRRYEGNVEAERGDFGRKVQADAETAENRKSQISQINDQKSASTNENLFNFEPKRGFFYHYQHTIPMPVEKVDLPDLSPASDNIPKSNVNADQSFQSAKQRIAVQPPTVVQPAKADQPQLDVVGAQSKQRFSRRLPVTLVRPFTEVHDAQVAPFQTAVNSQLFNIFRR